MSISQNLAALGITLPAPAAPVAAYVPYVIEGNMLYISGQLPMEHGKLAYAGLVGDSLTPEQGQLAARLCAINILAQAQLALGDLARIKRVVKLTGFVASPANFTAHPAVINGASELMQQVFGEAGKHARAAVGVSSLPLGAAVEVEAIFALQN